jgi:hypothetical protein
LRIANGLLLLAASAAFACAGEGIPLAQASSHATAARAESLSENTYLNLTTVSGKKIAGRGRATGTVAGSGSASLTLISATKAVGEFSGGSSGGSISGKFVATYRVAGAMSYFTGTVTSVRGTGRYSGARALGIKFSGSMNRVKLTMTLSAKGKWQR